MSRHQTFHFRGEREGRVAQMSRQEEVIARKRQELLEKQKTSELAKQVVAAQSGTTPPTPVASDPAKDVKHPSNLPKQTFEAEPPAPKNNFTNDGTFFENFRKITEAAKKAEEEKQKIEAARLAKEQEQQKAESAESGENADHDHALQPIPQLDSAFSTNSMSLGPPPPIKDSIIFHQTIPPFLNLAAPPPPPPPPVSIETAINVSQMNHPPQPPPPPFVQQAQPQFEGNNYLNENQMSRNIEQMERNIVNTHQQMNPQPLNSDMNPSINIAATIPTNIPTNIDDLIEYIAKNGDSFEEKIIAEIAQMNERSLFRFLNDKLSENYKIYRQKVLTYRSEKLGKPLSAKQDNNEKYDPEDILRDDEAEVETNPLKLLNIPSLSNSDDYDSDSEYMQETMERNLKNMKRRIVSGNMKKRYAESSTYSSDEGDHTDEEDHMEMYRKIQMRENAINEVTDPAKMAMKDFGDFKQEQEEKNSNFDLTQSNANRKKRSRWGEKIESNVEQPNQTPSTSNVKVHGNKPMLSAVKRTDPALLNYARLNYGTIDLTEEDWAKCEEHFKVNLLYQDMLRKRDELDRLAKSGQHKYEYDSDEDVEGGTWEHKIREAEMEATAAWADALNRQSEGKHHIGDFLPPEELKKFMEIYKAKQTNREPDLSDYKEYKLKEDNKGFQMLQKLGWTEGQGLGVDGGGIINPINKATQRDSNQGLGTTSNTTPQAGDNEYDAYRKRMMLAYRFRPNPLNNPRRAYY
ncbi:SURP and G-patch domain-containing protein 1 isoform X2 [Contarinia nasturtii]|uniref:SURP and G-patch domain-containing protein 1 isoform X2 n=1 Tax=Contarinia nasturtii TaxID=265458 RepID=UPI0012D3B3E7|nr:SURP and G-patch domain-containing protein 1 isoform X2 [Contarinia nasturtii]